MTSPNDPQQSRLAQILELLSPGGGQTRSQRTPEDDEAVDLAAVAQTAIDRDQAGPTPPPVEPVHARVTAAAAGGNEQAAGQSPQGPTADAAGTPAVDTPGDDEEGGLAASIGNLITYLRGVFTQQPAQQQKQQPSATAASSAASGTQQQTRAENEQAADEPGASGLGAILQALRDMNASNNQQQSGAPPDNGSESVGSLASLARGAAMATGALTALAAAVTFLNRRFTSMARNTLELNGVLDEYNGTIAQANALAEAAGIERAIEQGREIGPAYARLSAAQSEYRDIQQDFGAPIQSLTITITAAMAETRNSLLRKLEPFMDSVGDLARKVSEWLGTDPNSAAVMGSRAFLSDVSDGKFDGHGTTYLNPGNTPLMSDADRRSIFGP